MTRLVVCVLLCVVSLVQAGHEKYEGHQLYRVAGHSQEIAALEAKLDIISAVPAGISKSGKLEALVRLSPEEKQQWLQYFDQRYMEYTLVADNLADILRQEEAQIKAQRAHKQSRDETIGWDAFYSHDKINELLDELPGKFPGLVTVINAGLSYEGRQIKYLRISTTNFEDERKPVIIIDAMAHAREWITTPVAMYIIDQLIRANTLLASRVDWIIIPMVNPDGYEYSMTEDRMWRKTRSKAHEGADECPGVDINRNYDHEWGTSAASSDPCSIIYEGPTAWSEPETRVVRNAVLAHIRRTALYVSLHSYGNMVLYAWGNNGTLPSNGLMLHLAGVTMAEAIDKHALPEAKRYVVGNAAQVLYYTTGTSRDWTRAAGIPLTYTLELPGYEYGFLVPDTYLNQIVTETWAGVEAIAYHILETF